MPGGHGAQVKVVMSSAWFEDFSLKAIMGQDAQGCQPEEAVFRGRADGGIVVSLPAQPAALRPPGARAVMP